MAATDDLLREMHGTLSAMTVRVASIDEKVDALKHDVAVSRREITDRQDRTNGSVAAIKSEQEQAKGAIGVMRWLLAATVGLVGAGAAVAGVILALVAQGG